MNKIALNMKMIDQLDASISFLSESLISHHIVITLILLKIIDSELI